MSRVIYEPRCGMHIGSAAEKLCELAASSPDGAEMSFNGVYLPADAGTTPGDVIAAFHADMKRQSDETDAKRRAWEQTQEGQEVMRKAAERQRYVASEVAKGVLPFAVNDEAAWTECIAKNDDPDGACAVRYAARWANWMEARMADGAELRAIAYDVGNEADLEGITGFMYGCAVGMLARFWVHGEELRRWHNLKTQISSEGEAANESGGVLNPALLTIGGGED